MLIDPALLALLFASGAARQLALASSRFRGLQGGDPVVIIMVVLNHIIAIPI